MNTKRTVEDFLALFARKGVLLCSVNQVNAATWECSLRPEHKAVTAVGHGETFVECLADAWSRYKPRDSWDTFTLSAKPKRTMKRVRFKN